MRICCLLLLLTLLSCRKNKESADTEPPQVVITSPVNNDSYSHGDIVLIKATLTDNRKIVEVHMHVLDKTAGTLLFDLHLNPAAASYNLDQFIVAGSGISYKIQIIAKDNSANEGSASVEITSN